MSVEGDDFVQKPPRAVEMSTTNSYGQSAGWFINDVTSQQKNFNVVTSYLILFSATTPAPTVVPSTAAGRRPPFFSTGFHIGSTGGRYTTFPPWFQ